MQVSLARGLFTVVIGSTAGEHRLCMDNGKQRNRTWPQVGRDVMGGHAAYTDRNKDIPRDKQTRSIAKRQGSYK